MSSKSNYWENAILELLFNADAIPNIADNAGTDPLTNLYVSLHTADPGEAGDQTTSETAYTGYARVAVARTSGGWTVTANSVSPTANIEFGEVTASPGGDITHVGIGTDASGTGNMLYYGALSPNLTLSVGNIPRITTSSTIVED
jgi:hypothetical protein